ncbi:hypothetical protein [Xenophilus sp.]|uniref:hypothetical protein n=1 Tax=Xenophilus sp. TaxID=1873499 RepID=UPI0037DD36C0
MKTSNPATSKGMTASALASMATLPAMADSAAQRRAALLLHSMQDEDRRWLLAALPVEAQGALAPLLAELGALGIERDAQVLEAAIREVPARTRQVDILQANQGLAGDRRKGAAPWQADEAFLLALDRDGIRLLAGLLREEPPTLVAHLLQARPWPWQEAVLLGLDDAARRLVREQCGGDGSSGAPEAGAALRQAVLRAVAARLRDAVRQPVAPRARWWWNRRWRARVQPARVEA